MAWKLDSDRPIYSQLIEQIEMFIVSGSYPPGSKLPSVREFAAMAGVNPNTMQKTFSDLEQSGLIVTQRTAGRFVTEDTSLIKQIRTRLARAHVENFFAKLEQLGYEKTEILSLITAGNEEE